MVEEAPAGTLNNMAAAFSTRNGKRNSTNRTRLRLEKSAKRNLRRSKPARSQCLKKSLRNTLVNMRSCERRRGSSTLKSSRGNKWLSKIFLIILLSRRGHMKRSPFMIKRRSRRKKTEWMQGVKWWKRRRCMENMLNSNSSQRFRKRRKMSAWLWSRHLSTQSVNNKESVPAFGWRSRTHHQSHGGNGASCLEITRAGQQTRWILVLWAGEKFKLREVSALLCNRMIKIHRPHLTVKRS